MHQSGEFPDSGSPGGSSRSSSLVHISDITIIIISTNITLLCRLCLSENVQKHNHRRPYDQHNHNHKKMIMALTITMSLFFAVGTRKS